MRTFVKKTALGAAIIATLFACTKDVKDSPVSSQAGILSLENEKSAQKASEPKPEKKPTLTFSQSPVIATVGKPVTVSYTATDATTKEPINCGKITVYQWNGIDWVEVPLNPLTNSYTFIPATATECAYKFRAGFAPGGGGVTQCKGDYSGVEYDTQPEVCVDVQDCVADFTITNDAVEAKPVENGQYEFTITYTLTSPVDVTGVNFQGGATAGGKEGSSISELGNTVMVRHENNNNYVLVWKGDLKACTPQKVWFKYRRNFKCPATDEKVTGDWTASANGADLGAIAPLTYSCQ